MFYIIISFNIFEIGYVHVNRKIRLYVGLDRLILKSRINNHPLGVIGWFISL